MNRVEKLAEDCLLITDLAAALERMTAFIDAAYWTTPESAWVVQGLIADARAQLAAARGETP